jgi:hypothetical protein
MRMRTGNGGARLEERPIGDLLGELVQDGQRLLREEVRAAKAEIRDEAKKASRAGAAFGAGGALLHAALLCLAATIVLVGATFLAAWLSALIVTAILAGGGYAAWTYGKKRLAATDPSRAVAGIKEDGRWAKETMQSIKSSRHAHA